MENLQVTRRHHCERGQIRFSIPGIGGGGCMTRPDEFSSRFEVVVVVRMGLSVVTMRRDLLAAQKVGWKLHKRLWTRNPD